MLMWLRRNAGVQGLVGMLAGQIVALHFMLAGIVATQMAVGPSADAFAICHGSGQTSPGQTGDVDGHVTHAACAVCAFAAFAPPIPAVASLALRGEASSSTFERPPSIEAATSDRHDPRCSQGPPQSA